MVGLERGEQSVQKGGCTAQAVETETVSIYHRTE
jgi:hypothetical protein